jgi:hypothetical protein
LHIRQGTQVITSDNLPLEAFSIKPLAQAPKARKGQNLVSSAYAFEPSGARFAPSAVLVLAFDREALPPGSSPQNLVLGYYDPAQRQWLEYKGTPDPKTDEFRGKISHFSIYAVIAKTPPSDNRWLIWGACAVVLVGLGGVIYRHRHPRRRTAAAAGGADAGEAGAALLLPGSAGAATAQNDVITLVEGQDYDVLPNRGPASDERAATPARGGQEPAERQHDRINTPRRQGIHITFSIDIGRGPSVRSAPQPVDDESIDKRRPHS